MVKFYIVKLIKLHHLNFLLKVQEDNRW